MFCKSGKVSVMWKNQVEIKADIIIQSFLKRIYQWLKELQNHIKNYTRACSLYEIYHLHNSVIEHGRKRTITTKARQVKDGHVHTAHSITLQGRSLKLHELQPQSPRVCDPGRICPFSSKPYAKLPFPLLMSFLVTNCMYKDLLRGLIQGRNPNTSSFPAIFYFSILALPCPKG